tara:strand:- start:1536 stop:1799 length:264 start_codon:yes stop_codon:yes gene_type:complete
MSLPLLALREDAPQGYQAFRQYHEEKNQRIMTALWKEDWFLEYRYKRMLAERGQGPWPVFPTEEMDRFQERIEREMARDFPNYRGRR